MNIKQIYKNETFEMTLIRKDDVTSVNFDGEIALMDIPNGVYYYMDPVGSIIWETLQNPTTIDRIARHLILEYDIDLETCKKDVYDFILELMERDLALIL